MAVTAEEVDAFKVETTAHNPLFSTAASCSLYKAITARATRKTV